jgi:D-sedoheptulose 7-phosphate isomerase
MKETAAHKIDELVACYPNLAVCKNDILQAAEAMIRCYCGAGKLLVCGNGGSAADSLHIVGELMKGFVLPRTLDAQTQASLRAVAPQAAEYLIAHLQGALPAISLVSEVGLSTAYANDQAPELGFAQQVLGQGKAGDVLLAISTSGNSANVLYAAQVAKAKNIAVVGLTGQSGGKLKEWADVLIAVPEQETFKIQELHLPVYHAICLALEEEFWGE